MRKLILFLITIYQRIFSPDKGIFKRQYQGCRFYPSCSEYAKQAIEKRGIIRGIWLGSKRILRCHPWSEGGVDMIR
jgi:putative membrane protein insertion efficiency factor